MAHSAAAANAELKLWVSLLESELRARGADVIIGHNPHVGAHEWRLVFIEGDKTWQAQIDEALSLNAERLVLVQASAESIPREDWPECMRSQPVVQLDSLLAIPYLCIRMGLSPSWQDAEFEPFEVPSQHEHCHSSVNYARPEALEATGVVELHNQLKNSIGEGRHRDWILVRGSWGAGKSTLLSRLKRRVDGRPVEEVLEPTASGSTRATAKHFSAIEFNPSGLRDPEDVAVSFASALYAEIDRVVWGRAGMPLLRDLVSRVRLMRLRADMLMLLTGSALLIALWGLVASHLLISPDGLSYMLVSFPVAALSVAKTFPLTPPEPARKWIDTLFDPLGLRGKQLFLHRVRADIQHVLHAFSHRHFVIFVDDLDRCDPDVAADVTQALFQMLPEESTYSVIVAADLRRTAAGIASKWQDVIEVLEPETNQAGKLQYGERFLGKLFPRRYDVRVGIRDCVRLLDGLSALDEGSTSSALSTRRTINRLIDLVEFMNIALDGNPRDIKHFIAMLPHVVEHRPRSQWTWAKLAAIKLLWPELDDAAHADPLLLGTLEQVALNGSEWLGPVGIATVEQWTRNSDLIAVLRAGLQDRKRQTAWSHCMPLELSVLNLDGRKSDIDEFNDP